MQWGSGALVAVVVVGACGGGGADAEAVRGIEVEEIAVESDRPLASPVTVGGDALVAATSDGQGLRTSSDWGRSWEPVQLPELPVGAEVQLPERRADTVVVTAFEPTEPPESAQDRGVWYAWASRDGRVWSGGTLPSEGLADGTSAPVLGVSGRDVVAGMTTTDDDGSERLEVLHSPDGGVTWEATAVPQGADPISGGFVRVHGVWPVGGSGWVLVADVTAIGANEPMAVARWRSDDGGAHWRDDPCPMAQRGDVDECFPPPPGPGPTTVSGIDPPVERGVTEPEMGSVVELTGGGWLATASAQETGDQSWGYLLRSDDGERWRQLLVPDPCHDGSEVERPNASVAGPVALGGRWLVSYGCGDVIGTAWSQLLVLPADASEAVELPGTRQDGRSYGDPLAAPGEVVVPVDEEGVLTGLLLVRAELSRPGRRR